MEIDVYKMRWTELVQTLINAREHSLRTDIEIQHIINLLAHLERKIPDHKPEDVASLEEAE